MKVALVQTDLVWENPSENRNRIDLQIRSISEDTDLIVLPEMFTSGFTMNPERVAEEMEGETVSWLKSISNKRNCAITGSLVIKENDNFYNRLVFVFPTGAIETYDKKHLFTLAGENQVYTSGDERLIVNYKGFKICPLICYDLRFPVFSRNTVDYDVLIYVANWPQPRIMAWDLLLKARAVENMCYTIGVNRVGHDENKMNYTGHSQVVDFLGNYLVEPQESENIYFTELNKELLLETRHKFGFLNDRDDFELK